MDRMFKTDLAYENWQGKYRYGNETPLETQKRVAKSLASVEKSSEQKKWEDKFFKTLVRFDESYEPVGLKFTMGGRVTANIGTNFKGATLLNCYISGAVSGATLKYTRASEDGCISYPVTIKSNDSPDDLVNIFLTIMEQSKTLASEGGYGINFDWIRPRGSIIKGTGIEHPGVVSYMKIWDSVADCIVKGNNDGYVDKIRNYLKDDKAFKDGVEVVKAATRKGAMMGCLSVWHPDIEEFIRAKEVNRESKVLTKFNLSVVVDNEFMQAVADDGFYNLRFNGKVYKRVKARDLYNLIMDHTYNNNEPGVLFVDNMMSNNPLAYLGRMNATNPCGEIGGIPTLTTVCLLGSLNLTQYVRIIKDPAKATAVCDSVSFDWDQYAEDIKISTRMLDNVNDLTYNSLPSYDWATKNIRQFGMGLNGLGSALMMLGIPYNSKEALKFVRKATELKENLTWQASAELAAEKGTFKAYDSEKFQNTDYFKSNRLWPETKELIKAHGVRNGKTTTNPPLGNSSIICDNVSNGIEPVFLLEYERKKIVSKWPEGLTIDNIKQILKKKMEFGIEFWEGEYQGKSYYYEPHNRGLCEVCDVRDYGYSWLKENFPDIDHSAYTLTTAELKISDHLNVQEIVQFNCNQSVSKCLVEGTLIESDNGPIPVEEYLSGSYNTEGFYPSKNYRVYDGTGKPVSVKRAYYGGFKPCICVSLEAMPDLEVSENHIFETTRGWVSAKDLKEGDLIFENNYNYIHGKGNMSLGFSLDKFNFHYYKKITLPENMSEELAELLGMLAADGCIGWPSISLIEKDKTVGKRFNYLCRTLFKRQPKKLVDKRNGVISWVINSVPLVRFVEHCLRGSTCSNKRVPVQILRGSLNEKIAFLKGVSYYTLQRKNFCIYCGKSYWLARDCFSLCQQLSSTDCSWGSKWVEKHKYFVYSVTYTGSDIIPIELHKQKDTRKRDGIVWLTDSAMNLLSKPVSSTNYSLRGLKTRGSRIIRANTAIKSKLSYRPVRRVRLITDIGNKKVFDISLDTKDHTYLVNGLITHNTCNLPAEYPFDEFKGLYFDAWTRGLNGFTTYRAGTMESVLSDFSKPQNDGGIIEKDIKLPDTFVNGPTRIIKREGIKFYIHFSYLPEDVEQQYPIVIWIYTNNKEKNVSSVCNKASRKLAKLALEKGISKEIIEETLQKARVDYPHNRLGRMISLNLRHNVDRVDILTSLMDIEGDNISTLLTAVRKFLAESIDDGTSLKNVKCPSCGSEGNMVLQSGCSTCLDCGFSGCG